MMDKEELVEILSSWNFWKKDQEVGVYREKYLQRMEKLVQTDQIVAMIGVRRSGKSTLMKQFIKKQIGAGKNATSFLYINFEEPKFADCLSLEFLQKSYEAYKEIVSPEEKPYLILDEVQKVPQWERFARGLHEKKEARIIVSGSTSKLLSHDFGNVLTGRWVEIKVYPLDFKEFLEFNKVRVKEKLDVLSQKTEIKQLLRKYLEFGGFPLVVLKEEKEEILKRYFEDITGRDIVQKHRIKKGDKIGVLAKYYLTNFSSLASYRKIAKFVGLSLDSVERFSRYMNEAYLLYFVPKFSYALREQEINLRKVYSIDTGLVNVVSFRFSDNIGRLYENVVFLTLMQKGMELYYSSGKGECDFVIKDGQRIKQLMQVVYKIEECKEREMKGLLEAMKSYKIKEGLIITGDYEGEEKVGSKRVKYVPLWKWLLDS